MAKETQTKNVLDRMIVKDCPHEGREIKVHNASPLSRFITADQIRSGERYVPSRDPRKTGKFVPEPRNPNEVVVRGAKRAAGKLRFNAQTGEERREERREDKRAQRGDNSNKGMVGYAPSYPWEG